jgi:hypothetical protein
MQAVASGSGSVGTELAVVVACTVGFLVLGAATLPRRSA